jgi:CO/xanthine dehydrogenase Mo-binding subunit
MALMEGTVIDPIRGWIATSDLASYHVPTHADIPELDVVFVDERDERVNPLGIKGVGELAIVGVAAAVANAVFHATDNEWERKLHSQSGFCHRSRERHWPGDGAGVCARRR